MHSGDGGNHGLVAAVGVEGAALVQSDARIRVGVAPEEERPPYLRMVVHDRHAAAVWRG